MAERSRKPRTVSRCILIVDGKSTTDLAAGASAIYSSLMRELGRVTAENADLRRAPPPPPTQGEEETARSIVRHHVNHLKYERARHPHFRQRSMRMSWLRRLPPPYASAPTRRRGTRI